MRDRLRAHGEESRRQQQRLARILESPGTSSSSLKDIGTSIMGNVAALGHAVAQDEVVKNSFANCAFEHHEIATYLALLEMADAAGDGSAPLLLQDSLDEEKRMATWIEQHLSPTLRRYMELESQGQKSGV